MGDDRDAAHTRHMTPVQSVSDKKRKFPLASRI